MNNAAFISLWVESKYRILLLESLVLCFGIMVAILSCFFQFIPAFFWALCFQECHLIGKDVAITEN